MATHVTVRASFVSADRDAQLEVFAWDAQGQAVARAPFSWRCTVALEEWSADQTWRPNVREIIGLSTSENCLGEEPGQEMRGHRRRPSPARWIRASHSSRRRPTAPAELSLVFTRAC